jgi:hypothetical protein
MRSHGSAPVTRYREGRRFFRKRVDNPKPGGRSNACYYGADLAALPGQETDGAHVHGPSNTGCTDSNTSRIERGARRALREV